jgi:hypothetical protein
VVASVKSIVRIIFVTPRLDASYYLINHTPREDLDGQHENHDPIPVSQKEQKHRSVALRFVSLTYAERFLEYQEYLKIVSKSVAPEGEQGQN